MEKIVNTPHDHFFRAALSDLRVAKDFFEQHLPPAIKNIVDLSRLKVCKESYIDARLKLGITDMLFETCFKDYSGFIYLLNEHSSTPQKFMPLRLLKYAIPIMEEKSKNNEHGLLPIVYPMVFYTGSGSYSYSTDIFDLFENPTLAREIFVKPFHLVDVNKIPDDVLKQKVWSGIMGLSMKHIYERDILPHLKNMISLLQEAECADGKRYIKTTLTYMLNAGKLVDEQAFVNIIQEGLSPDIGGEMATIAEMFVARGMKEEIEKGLQKGQVTAKKAIARNLLQQGTLSLEEISKVTELPVSELLT